MAMQFWNVVIERTGTSRFPIDKAREQHRVAEAMFEVAERLRAEQEGSSSDEEAVQIRA